MMTTSVRMWCFLLFAAFMPIVPTVTEVVDSVSQCAGFLLNESPPQIPDILQRGNILDQNRYKLICQTYRDQRRFLTLYDTENKIPVFSAYKYKGKRQIKRPSPKWRIEEQLEDRNTGNMRDDEYANQASNDDYKADKEYNRGHLFPVCHAYDYNDKSSTFTLTNIVPQAVTFNNGSWEKMESCTKCILQKYCINKNGVHEGFVVTGAQPSPSNKLNNRVNIPSMLWTAFCCYSSNTNRWLASAHWGDNIAEPESNKYLQTKTLAELHQELSTENSIFMVFPGTQCEHNRNVAEFYPEMAWHCKCPPLGSTTTSKPQTTTIPPTTTAVPKATSKTRSTTTTRKKDENNSENTEDSGQEENQERPEENDNIIWRTLKGISSSLRNVLASTLETVQGVYLKVKISVGDAVEGMLEAVA